jgi:DNA-binding MarR family transcriptional regulator
VKAAASPARDAWAVIMQLVKAAKMQSMAEFDLTPAQAHLLAQLDPDQPVPMSDVANTLGCDASNVTGLVDRLEAHSLIERRPDDKDRRVKMVAVTAKGARLRARLLARWYEAPAELAALPLRDQKELARILRRAVERG